MAGGLLDYDWMKAADDLDPAATPDLSGVLAGLQTRPVEVAPAKALIDTHATPAEPKKPGLWSRIKTGAMKADESGLTPIDRIYMAGSIATGDDAGAMSYRNAITTQAEKRRAEDRTKRRNALFRKAYANGKWDGETWKKGLGELGDDYDIDEVLAIEKAFGPQNQVWNTGDGLFAGDTRDPTTIRRIAKGRPKYMRVGEDLVQLPDDYQGDGSEFGGVPADGGMLGGGEATPAGADVLPDQVPAAAQAQAAAGPVAYTPQDLDALTRMLATEAIGEGEQGMMAVGHVALNRLARKHGGATSLAGVINAPQQFTGMSRAGQVTPQDYATAQTVAKRLLAGGATDPTGGAVNYLNPELQAQNGDPQPNWAPQGQGQRIGRHVFYGGRPGQPAAAPQAQVAQAGPTGQPTLAGGSGADNLPPGAKVVYRGKPKPEEKWVEMSPQESLRYGPGIWARNSKSGDVKLQSKLPDTEKAKGAKPPAQLQKMYVQDKAVSQQIAAAIAEVKKTPSAFGLKNFLPDTVVQRTTSDAEKVARAKVAELASAKRHEISGASVTLSEQPVLRPFLPTATDTQETVLVKLKQMQRAIANDIASFETTYEGFAGAGAAGSGPPPEMLKSGVVTDFGDKGQWTLDPSGQPKRVK